MFSWPTSLSLDSLIVHSNTLFTQTSSVLKTCPYRRNLLLWTSWPILLYLLFLTTASIQRLSNNFTPHIRIIILISCLMPVHFLYSVNMYLYHVNSYLQLGWYLSGGSWGTSPLTGSDLPSHWFVWILRGNRKGEGRERGGWGRPPALLPPTGFCLKYHPLWLLLVTACNNTETSLQWWRVQWPQLKPAVANK